MDTMDMSMTTVIIMIMMMVMTDVMLRVHFHCPYPLGHHGYVHDSGRQILMQNMRLYFQVFLVCTGTLVSTRFHQPTRRTLPTTDTTMQLLLHHLHLLLSMATMMDITEGDRGTINVKN